MKEHRNKLVNKSPFTPKVVCQLSLLREYFPLFSVVRHELKHPRYRCIDKFSFGSHYLSRDKCVRARDKHAQSWLPICKDGSMVETCLPSFGCEALFLRGRWPLDRLEANKYTNIFNMDFCIVISCEKLSFRESCLPSFLFY